MKWMDKKNGYNWSSDDKPGGETVYVIKQKSKWKRKRFVVSLSQGWDESLHSVIGLARTKSQTVSNDYTGVSRYIWPPQTNRTSKPSQAPFTKANISFNYWKVSFMVPVKVPHDCSWCYYEDTLKLYCLISASVWWSSTEHTHTHTHVSGFSGYQELIY